MVKTPSPNPFYYFCKADRQHNSLVKFIQDRRPKILICKGLHINTAAPYLSTSPPVSALCLTHRASG